jgi:hypothetical protein
MFRKNDFTESMGIHFQLFLAASFNLNTRKASKNSISLSLKYGLLCLFGTKTLSLLFFDMPITAHLTSDQEKKDSSIRAEEGKKKW